MLARPPLRSRRQWEIDDDEGGGGDDDRGWSRDDDRGWRRDDDRGLRNEDAAVQSRGPEGVKAPGTG